jgi:hypothetical protein
MLLPGARSMDTQDAGLKARRYEVCEVLEWTFPQRPKPVDSMSFCGMAEAMP